MSDYTPIHDTVTGQFSEQPQSAPDRPLVPEQHITSNDPRPMPSLFQQNLSPAQTDRLCQARNYCDGQQPFVLPSTVQGPGGVPELGPARAYFVDQEDLYTVRLLVDVDGTVSEYETRKDGVWRSDLNDYMMGQLAQPIADDQDLSNQFSVPLTARQDRVLLRFNEYRYALNTCTRPDGDGGVEAINFRDANDEAAGLRRIQINAGGFVTSIATMVEQAGFEPVWSEWDPESDEFGAIANDRMTYAEQVAKSAEIKDALARVKARAVE